MKDLEEKLSVLRLLWDSEVEAERLALEILNYGSPGIDALARLLAEVSSDQPKLSVAILNCFREKPTPPALQRLADLLEEDALSEEDMAYAMTILGDHGSDQKEGARLVRTLRRVRDPVNRVELLSRIVQLHVSEAREPLRQLAAQIPPDALDYVHDSEAASREEMVFFAIDALDGHYDKLESVAFDQGNPTPRRAAALGMLCLALGSRSLPLMKRAVGDANRTIRGTVLSLIGEIGLRESVDLLRAGLEDTEPWVVYQAYHAIRRLLSIPDFSEDLGVMQELKNSVLSALGRLESSEDKTVRQIVLPALRNVLGAIQRLLRTG